MYTLLVTSNQARTIKHNFLYKLQINRSPSVMDNVQFILDCKDTFSIEASPTQMYKENKIRDKADVTCISSVEMAYEYYEWQRMKKSRFCLQHLKRKSFA